jgi:hypothetical protein
MSAVHGVMGRKIHQGDLRVKLMVGKQGRRLRRRRKRENRGAMAVVVI